MKVKSLLLVMSVVGIAILFLSASIFAGTTVPDVIKMETKGYEKHEKGAVSFSHKKHVEEYKGACGDCHHDAKGKPLANLKAGDKVQGCIECHKKPGEKPKGKDAPKLSKKEDLEYHAEALHDNCQGCHKEFNKKNNSKAAPTTCAKCHEKK
jgi:cytochrome c553